MRKIYTFLFAFFAFASVNAQQPTIGEGQMMDFDGIGTSTEVVDTVELYLTRASGAVLFGSQDGGYVTGTGYFDNSGTLVPVTDATGMHYDGIAGAYVLEILTWFGDVTIEGAADNVTGRVWSVNADTTPDVQLGVGTVASSLFTGSTSFVYSSIPITSGDGNTMGNPFMVTVNYAGITDTLGIVSSNPDSADGQGEFRLRQLTSAPFGAQWGSIEDLWGPFNCDAFIVPVVNDTFIVGVGAAVSSKGLELHGNYPNPAINVSEIRYAIANQEEVKITVFDLAAKEIYNSGWNMMTAGEHAVRVDVSEKPAGAYYYKIETRNTALTSKLHVLK